MGAVEEKLNAESPNYFPISEIVTEILRLQFSKRSDADNNDCLLQKCEKIFLEESLRLRKNRTEK